MPGPLIPAAPFRPTSLFTFAEVSTDKFGKK